MIKRVTTTQWLINTKKSDVDYLFHLSELAFAVELEFFMNMKDRIKVEDLTFYP
jgi:hypothetical protein